MSVVPGLSLEGEALFFLSSAGDPLLLLPMPRSANCGKPESGVRFSRALAFPGEEGVDGSVGSLPSVSNMEADLFEDLEGVRGGVVGECCAVNESSESLSLPSSSSPMSGDTARIVISR